MLNIRNISIIASFAGLWVSSLFSSELEIILGFILIFSFGMFHGSNDILLITTLSSKNSSGFSYKVLGIYVATVLLAVLLFYFLPAIGLIGFVLFSAFHFGEQHFSNFPFNLKPIVTNLYYGSYGLLILCLLFLLNPTDVIEVVQSITGKTISEGFIDYLFYISLGIYILFTGFLYLKHKSRGKYLLMEFFYLLVFTIIFKVSSLIWGFTIYFVFWHSIPSLIEQVNFLHGSFNTKNMLQYFKNAVWYWLISLVGLAGVYFLFAKDQLFYAILFSFIAAVTFPHTLVITNMFKIKKTQPNS